MMITGLNHLTLAVSDLARSFDFYVNTLGASPHVKWDRGAYLTLGDIWLCLSQGDIVSPRDDYTHLAVTVATERFEDMKQQLLKAGVRAWQENKSEGASFYFLDPDDHKLELHVGSLESRLAALRERPYDGLVWF